MPILFRRDAGRRARRQPSALAPWLAASQAGRLENARWRALDGGLHTAGRSPLQAGTDVLCSSFETRKGAPSNPICASALAPTQSPALHPVLHASMGERPPLSPAGS